MFKQITFTCRIDPEDTLRIEREVYNAEEGLRFFALHYRTGASAMLNTAQLTKLRDRITEFLGTESPSTANLWTEG